MPFGLPVATNSSDGVRFASRRTAALWRGGSMWHGLQGKVSRLHLLCGLIQEVKAELGNVFLRSKVAGVGEEQRGTAALLCAHRAGKVMG